MITAMQTSTCRTSILSRSWPGKLWIFHHKSKLLLHEHVAWQERWASIEKDPSNRSNISAAWELNTEIFLRSLWILFFLKEMIHPYRASCGQNLKDCAWFQYGWRSNRIYTILYSMQSHQVPIALHVPWTLSPRVSNGQSTARKIGPWWPMYV